MEEIYVVATRPPPPPPEPVWFEVEINATHPGTDLFLHNSTGYLAVREADLRLWRLKRPDSEPRLEDGELFYRIDDLPGLVYRIDEDTQSLVIDAPARLFLETSLDGQRPPGALPAPSPLGGLLNYDVIVTHSDADGTTLTAISGLLEAGIFGPLGEGTTEFIRTHPTLTPPAEVRLDTLWTQDRPAGMASLRLGDSVTGAASWSDAVRFGGIQWSRDFTTQPGFVTTPLFGMHGEAVLPSTLQLYVNDALRMSTPVPPGPFRINDLPLISGAGNAELVVTDVLGRQQQITVPYYMAPTLLRPGLSSFSYEIGVVREDYGLHSDDYAHALAVATHRYGFTSEFTGEVHGEVLRDQQTFGLDGVWLPHQFAVVTAAIAASHSRAGAGELLDFGIERQWRYLSFGGSARVESDKFVDDGMQAGIPAPVRMLQGYFSLPLPRRGAVSMNYLQQDYRGAPAVHLLSGQASWQVTASGYLSFNAIKPLRRSGSASATPTVGLNFIYSLGSRTSISATAIRQQPTAEEQLTVQQSLPAGSGFGYKVTAGAGDTAPFDGVASYQDRYGTYTLHGERAAGNTSVSAEAQGGVALLGGEAFLSRRLDESFAVVRVGNYPGVRVYADNQEVAVTDSHGAALVPRVRPYERNPIRIEDDDLPLDADVGPTELDAVPYRRSGVLLDFDVKRSTGALITLLRADGSPVPIGAVAQLVGHDTEFAIGERGETYITGLAADSRLHVEWPGQNCDIELHYVPSSEPIPRLGPYTCGRPPP